MTGVILDIDNNSQQLSCIALDTRPETKSLIFLLLGVKPLGNPYVLYLTWL